MAQDKGVMEDDYKTNLFDEDEVDMDVDMGLDVALVEDRRMGIGHINHVDYSDAFNTTEVFPTRDDVLKWARAIAFELGFVIVITRSDTFTGQKGRSTYVVLGCERSGKYRAYKKDLVPTVSGTKKCNCPFKLRAKPMQGCEGWIVKLVCGSHNHALGKSLVDHPYASILTSKEKTIFGDMTKNMVKSKNIIQSKEKNGKAYRSVIKDDSIKMQHLMKLLERDMYIHWHRVKDIDVVRDIFWIHPDTIKLVNACHIVLLIDSTYKTNRYRCPLLEIVGVTPTDRTFSVAFAYLESEHINNVVWAFERLRGVFLRRDVMPQVIVTDKNAAFMNAVKIVFPKSINLLCRFHIDKNVKAKCKMYVHPREAWDHVMDAWGSVMDCPTDIEYDDHIAKFEVVCSPWPMFVDYIKYTWLVPHKERFVKAWTDKVMHLGNTTTNRAESIHSTLKILLQNSIEDLCNSWDAINNMITLQHSELKESLASSIYHWSHIFNVNLYKKLRGVVSTYALHQIASECWRVKFVGSDSSRCGCVLRSTYALPCACELAKYDIGSLPLETVHMFWRRLSILDVGVCEPEISMKKEMEVIEKQFREADICEKLIIKSKLRDIAYSDLTSMCLPHEKVKTRGSQKKSVARQETSTKCAPSYLEHVDTLHSMHDSSSML